ncbi:MAG: putative DNA binding domain-containing protein [Muribaculaceae bacterium]|nr:putative DNA binding domain-containing protein [Muribaculaceae bacterium]
MITKEEVNSLRFSKETSRIERTISKGDMDKFQEAICAFSNDMANSRKPGYLLIGVHDDGRLSGLRVDDKFFIKISAIRSSGNILPLPVMTVESYEFEDGDVLVVEVQPSLYPPVRYRGRTFIRVGPRRDIASEAEERILIERRTAYMPTFDTTPCFHAKLTDLNTEKFRNVFLPSAVSKEELKRDDRSVKEQMASVGMYDLDNDCPTFGAIALFGYKPRQFMPGLYTQFVRFKGSDVTDEVDDERQFEGGYIEILPKLEAFLEMSVIRKRPVPVSILREEMVSNYPYWGLRELILNAYMHRDLRGNGPIRFYEFEDRIEIMNPGGLYGNSRPENFPKVNDYRNPLIASAFKTLGYVNMFNRGVREVQTQLNENGNTPAVFNVENLTVFEVIIYSSSLSKGDKSEWTSEGTSQDNGYQSEGISQGINYFINQEVSIASQRGVPSQGVPSQGTCRDTSQDKGDKSERTSQAKGDKSEKSGISFVQKSILKFCTDPKSLREIGEYLGVKRHRKIKERYLNDLLESRKILMTIPDKPTSRFQKYVATKRSDMD